MIDINFYMKIHSLKQKILNGEYSAKDNKEEISNIFNSHLSPSPVVGAIETTNSCPLRCVFCPRTELMTRPIKRMDMEVFDRIIPQISPWKKDEWNKWENFVQREYGVPKEEMSENNFFLYVIAKSVILHGYGEPAVDALMSQRIEKLTEAGLKTYFSCNPSLINVNKTIKNMQAGLNFVKYSVDSVDDIEQI